MNYFLFEFGDAFFGFMDWEEGLQLHHTLVPQLAALPQGVNILRVLEIFPCNKALFALLQVLLHGIQFVDFILPKQLN